jgi:hypothetical protein
MRQVRTHAESNDLVPLAVLLGFEQIVALVAVNNKQLVPANSVPPFYAHQNYFNHFRPSSFDVQPFSGTAITES